MMRDSRAALRDIERDAVAHRESGSAEPFARANEMDAEITRHRHAWRQITSIKNEQVKRGAVTARGRK